MGDLVFFLLLISGYILGSVLFGDIIAKAKGVDLRKVGSGNVGATNVRRALGKKYGIIVFILDALKGFIPTYLSLSLLENEWHIAFVALSPILGHIFPIFYRFKGGKGVATSFGVILALYPLGALICLLIWVGILYITKYVSLASMTAVASSPFIIALSGGSLPYVILAVVVALLVVFSHRSNISRLIAGKEHRINEKA